MKPKIQLVTRADDAGSCRSANEAILEGVEAGVIKNVSFMAVGPELEHAVRLLGGRDDICYGFHICLNAEWDAVKWKPLTESPNLTDSNGFFLPTPAQTKAQLDWLTQEEYKQNDHIPEPADIWGAVDWEVQAQLERLRDLDLPISYVDEHMGVSRIGLRATIAQLCQFERLIDAFPLPSLPPGDGLASLAALENRLKRAMLGAYVWVTHPGQIAPDMERFYLSGGEPGVVARERDAERQLLCDERLMPLFQQWRVKPCRYDEVLAP